MAIKVTPVLDGKDHIVVKLRPQCSSSFGNFGTVSTPTLEVVNGKWRNDIRPHPDPLPDPPALRSGAMQERENPSPPL